MVNGTGWYYNNVAGGVEITHAGPVSYHLCANYSGDVVIPKVLAGKTVVAISWSAFRDCSNLKSVIIPDSVASIGTSAFYNCSSLMYVRLPNPPPIMGSDVFEGTPYKASVLSASYNVNEAVIKATEAAENTLNIVSRLDNTTYGLSALNTQISELKNNSVSKDDITNLQNAINNIQSSMAPTITKVNGVNNSTATKTGTITIEISSSNATEYRARDKAGAWSEWTTSNTIPVFLLSKGVRTIEIQARNGGEGSAVANHTMTAFSL